MRREQSLETILTLVMASTIFFIFTKAGWLLWLALCLGMIGLFFKKISYWISRLWLKLAEILGAIMSRIILSTVFFVLLSPLALLSRLFRRDTLRLSRKSSGSYYIEREHRFSRNDLLNPW